MAGMTTGKTFMNRVTLLVVLIIALFVAVIIVTANQGRPTVGLRSASGVLWTADATKGIENEWASMSTGTHCSKTTYAGMTDPNMFQVSDPTAVHGRAYRSQITTADNSQKGCYTSAIREEINQGNNSKTFADGVDRTFHEGQERWISLQIKLDSNLPTWAQGWKGSSIVQLTHPSGNDGGLFNLNTSGSGSHDQWDIWGYSNTSPGNQGRYDHPLGSLLADRGKWVKFTFHILFSSGSNGFAEVYSDLANPGASGPLPLLWRRNGPTIKAPRAYAFMTYGFYATRPVPSTIGAELAGLTVATDRASAETSAFGQGSTTSTTSTTSTAGGLTAAFTGPATSSIGQADTFDSSSSTGSPTSYSWTDAGANNVVLGTGPTLNFTFHYKGTKKITLTETDASGATSTVEHNLVVS